MTKQELLTKIDAEMALANACATAAYLLGQGLWITPLKEQLGGQQIGMQVVSNANTATFSQDVDSVVGRYSAGDALQKDPLNIFRLGLKNMLSQSAESIQAHCDGGPLQQKWQDAHWRPFSRLLRNSFSHDFMFNFAQKGTTQLRDDVSLTFSHGKVTLSNTLHGQEIDFDNLPIPCVFELVTMMRDWVSQEL